MPELDLLKTIAILMLFFVHSYLDLNPSEAFVLATHYMLGIFMFVSGYLLYISLIKKDRKLRSLISDKLKSIYFPSLSIVVFSFATGFMTNLGVSPIVIVLFASLLSNFEVLAVGIYDPHAFWFIPTLLAFMAIMILLEKILPSTKIQTFAVLSIFTFGIACSQIAPSIQLSWWFIRFLLVFAAGFWISKHFPLGQMKAKICLALVIPILLTIPNFSTSFTYGFFSELYLKGRYSIFCISAFLISYYFLRKPSTNQIIQKITAFVAPLTLYIYLIEPLVSSWVTFLVFGNPNYYFLTGTDLILSFPLRIFVVFLIALFLKMAFQKLWKVFASLRKTRIKIIIEIGR